MKGDRLPVLLSEIQALVQECIRLTERSGKLRGRRTAGLEQKAAKGALPEWILELRDKGFFSQPKTGNQVQSKLNPAYACELDRVLMALLRLAKRKKLRKASKVIDGRKQVAYVW